MLHEIIMCLLGNVGGLFQQTTQSNSRNKIKLVENLEFIHPAEVEICNKLAELGTHYRQINHFIETYSFAKTFPKQSQTKPVLKYGIYLVSFCDALRQAVVEPYIQVISELEKSLLTEHYLNVTYLQTHLESHFVLFTSVSNLLNDIERKQLHGCQIIDAIYRYSISGNMTIRSTFSEILQVTQEVMFKQLRDWMVCGRLNDHYGEFFIGLDERRKDEQATMIDSIMPGVTGELPAAAKENTANEAEDLLFGSNRFTSIYSQYTLNSTKLPCYISLKIANKILFTGELLQIFQQQDRTGIFSNEHSSATATRTSIDELAKMNDRLDEFSKEIYERSLLEFSVINFEELVNKIRDHVSESVWHLIVYKYNLIGEFQKLKDMFLIGRGELFATFLESASGLLNKVVDSSLEYSVNYYFQKSISRMLLDDETWLTKFRFIVNEAKSTGEDGWRRIGLAYKVDWPFNSLITPKVLKKYNEIFGYLLLIRRVQMQLHKCLGLEIRLKKMAKPGLRSKVSSARFHMSFLIDNIQFYLQSDVLETQFMELENKIKQSKDFEQIRFAHDTFITKIQTQTFMLNKTVCSLLVEIIESCLAFSKLVVENVEGGKELPEEECNFIIRDFQNHTHVLYKTFKTLEKRQMGSQLEQLLTRINFNGYLADNDGFLIK